jgi:polyketide synthase PksN
MNNESLTISQILNRIEDHSLDPEEGLRLLQAALVPAGIPAAPSSGDDSAAGAKPLSGESQSGGPQQRMEEFLKGIFAQLTKLPLSGLHSRTSFEHYGIDSIMVMNLNRELEKHFGELSKTLFFEYQNLHDLAEFLLNHHGDRLPAAAPSPFTLKFPAATAAETGGEPSGELRPRFSTIPAPLSVHPAVGEDDLAIIGVSGRFPMARNLEEYWRNLRNGLDCIGEIPGERWDYRDYYDPDQDNPNKSYSKWGGFIDDVDKFDPLFFNISPREARLMDPQERLFLETAWHTVEDAGYTREQLNNEKVGVFVGIMNGQYPLLGLERFPGGDGFVPGGLFASVANRVSAFFNFHGPSLSLDTMCSSSLTAIHLACESIRRGDSKLALAGGVNVTIHPIKFVQLSRGGFASTDGRCRSFGAGGDGFVTSEGVGAILIKPLQQALADQDRIYALIKGSAVNHGGRTSGFTVPNPNAQAEVILEALRKAKVDPRTINYLETHGTGTALGDPIEITGLAKAFGQFTSDRQFCAIGSVKSNIGHLEPAAGIAAIAKVLLQLKHRKLVPSLHSKRLNPNLNFIDTPFYVQRRLTEWRQPETGAGGTAGKYPRRAGVSSFGAGGSNAHIILEEYPPRERSSAPDAPGPQIIVFSAKTRERLAEYAARFAEFLTWEADSGYPNLYGEYRKGSFTDSQILADLAFTLQTREAMEHRLALVVASLDQLREGLAGYLQQQPRTGPVFEGNSKDPGSPAGEPGIGAADLSGLKAEQIAALWVSGTEVDWRSRRPTGVARLVTIPHYPFAKERYWAPELRTDSRDQTRPTAGLHPLIDDNASDFWEQKFILRFAGKERFLAGQLIPGCRVLPELAVVEMIRKAGELAGQCRVREITGLVWTGLMVREEAPEIGIHLYPGEGGADCEIKSGAGEAAGCFVRGRLHFEAAPAADPENVDLEALASRCPIHQSGPDCYRIFQKTGFKYEPESQVLQSLWSNEGEALARLALPREEAGPPPELELHPLLLDGAVQAISLKENPALEYRKYYLPCSAAAVRLYHPLANECFAAVTAADPAFKDDPEAKTYDIRFTDATGRLLVQMSGLTVRRLRNEQIAACLAVQAAEAQPASSAVFYYYYDWEKAADCVAPPGAGPLKPVLIFDAAPGPGTAIKEALTPKLPELQGILVQPGTQYQRMETGDFEIRPDHPEDYRQLFCDLQSRRIQPEQLLFRWEGPAPEPPGVSGDWGERYLARGVYPLFYIVKALAAVKFRSIKRLIAVYSGDGESRPFMEAISGYAKSLQLIWPDLWLSTLELPREPEFAGAVLFAELTGAANALTVEARYEGLTRLVKKIKPWSQQPVTDGGLLKQRGVYLITGGAGGIGLVFARYLAEKYEAQLILTGRSRLSPAKAAQLEELGANVLYLQADVADHPSMQAVLDTAHRRFGPINGIIHAAGGIDEKLIHQKELADVQATLAPKIRGTLILDALTQAEPLDFLVLFSSVSAVLGDFGQCDYSVGNRFLDSFAAWRDRLREQKQRSGRTVAINWSLWREGGMHFNREGEQLYLQSSGMRYLEASDALRAFEAVLAGNTPQVMVLAGEQTRIEQFLNVAGPQSEPVKLPEPTVTLSGGPADSLPLERRLELDIRKIGAAILLVNPERLDPAENLGSFGFNSIMLKEFARQLSRIYRVEVAPTVFFSRSSFAKLRDYLLEEYGDSVREYYGRITVRNETQAGAAAVAPAVAPPLRATNEPPPRTGGWRFTPLEQGRTGVRVASLEPVAIIGAAGIFPGSRDLHEFWAHLEAGHDLITEIPLERFDWREYYSPQYAKNKMVSKWGGFIDDVDKFDAGFYNISPREARYMDPQHRLFLETVWHTVEDAGYRASELSGRNIGVFAGVQFIDYQHLLVGMGNTEPHMATGNAHTMIVNRVSFYHNWNGPSEAIDTACSSSLVAVHRAVKSIQSGESEMAVAGGVSLILAPAGFLAASELGILSPDGRCMTFTKHANGYVRGEGVGALLLKPLSQAVADHDHIYAVIKGTAVKHGGKAASLTAPNSDVQAALLIAAYQEAGFDPETISYIETHGTGTELGDPVEFEGLKKAFKGLAKQRVQSGGRTNYCGLGAVKTNIGHLEPAAGIAGILKVVLAMQHRKLPGTLHFNELNPYIDLTGTPFYIVDRTKPWERVPDQSGRPGPRRAGVSSFGFGGAYAHIALEEYEHPAPVRPAEDEPVLIVLSAKNEARLKAYAAQFRSFLEAQPSDSPGSLVDLAYTLQTGREAMEERLALIAAERGAIIRKLSQYCQDQSQIEGMWQGNIRDAAKLSPIIQAEAGKRIINSLAAEGDLVQLANLWVSGADIPWRSLYSGRQLYRVGLPTYPFAKERYWFTGPARAKRSEERRVIEIHPLLDANRSTFGEQIFTKCYSQEDADYALGGITILPPAFYLEMAWAAGRLSVNRATLQTISGHRWGRPLILEQEPRELALRLYEDGEGVAYEAVTVAPDGAETVHAQGRLDYAGLNPAPGLAAVDLDGMRMRCPERMERAEFYRQLAAARYQIGPGLQAVAEVRYNQVEALVRLSLADGFKADWDEFVLHPLFMEGIFQTLAGFPGRKSPEAGVAYLPFALEEVRILKPLSQTCYAHVQRVSAPPQAAAETEVYAVRLLDEAGQVLTALSKLTVKKTHVKTVCSFTSHREQPQLLELLQQLEAGKLEVAEVGQLMEEQHG